MLDLTYEISRNRDTRLTIDTAKLLDFLHTLFLLLEYIESVCRNAVRHWRVCYALVDASVGKLAPFIREGRLSHALLEEFEVV